MNLPQTLFIEMTTECNLGCKHCHMWLNKDQLDVLSITQKINLIEQFYKINPNGMVSLSGGEPMLQEENFFILTEKCRELKITCVVNTNATKINENNYLRILESGPTYLIISLDSHLESIHDYIRGKKGAFNQVVKTIKDLTNIKAKLQNINTEIYLSSVLFNKNITLCDEFIHFAKKELHVDGLLFQCLIRTYYNKSVTSDPFFEKNFFQDKELALIKIDELIKKYENDSFVLTTTKDFELIKLYISNYHELESIEQICNSQEKNIVINQNGKYNLCFYMDELDDVKMSLNVKDISIIDMWNSIEAKEAREMMRDCKKDCSIINCHRK